MSHSPIFTVLLLGFIIGSGAFAPAAERGRDEGYRLPADLWTYENIVDQMASRIHHPELNEAINTFRRRLQQLRAQHASAIGANARGGEGRATPFATEAEEVMRLGQDAVERLKTVVPLIEIRMDGEAIQASVAPSPAIVAQRPEFLLVEVSCPENGKPATFAIEEGEGSGVGVKAQTVRCEPGAARWTVVEIHADSPGELTLRLNISIQPERSDTSGPAPVALESMLRANPSGILRAVIFDETTGEKAPARIYALGADGRYVIPDDHDQDRPSNWDFAWGYFYGDGGFEARLPEGTATIRIERGFEYQPLVQEVEIRADETAEASFRLARWIDMVERGWFSVDSHLHYVRNSWHEEGDYDELDTRKRAEDINVGHILPLMHWWRNIDLVAVSSNRYPPRKGLLEKYSDGRYVTAVGEEMRNDDFFGHLVFWNIDGLVEPVSTGWMGGPDMPDYPSNTLMARKVHAQSGYVAAAHDVVREVPVMAALGALDLLDLHGPDRWYHLLNCGFRLPAMIGSDFPANRMGFERGYVYLGKSEFDWDDFLAAMVGGRTMVSSGAMVFLEVDGGIAGDVIGIEPNGPHKAHIRASARWLEPLQRLEIVHNGVVVKQVRPETPQTTIEFEGEIELPGKGWIAARCSAGNQNNWWPVEGIAHVSPIYLDDGTGPYVSAESAQAMLTISETTMARAEARMKTDTPEQKAEVLALFEEGIAHYRDLIARSGGSPDGAPGGAGGR